MRSPGSQAVGATALVVLCLGSPVAAARGQDDAGRIKRAGRACFQAERALRVGALDRAQERFEAALELQPGFPNAHIGLGHVAMARESYDVALSHYVTAREQFVHLGDTLRDLQAQRYRSATSDIAALLDQIRHLQRFSGSVNTQQMVFELQGRMAQLAMVLPPDPRRDDGQPPAEYDFYIGNALFQLGRLDQAIEAWERCRAADPEFSMAYNNLALGYWKQGRVAEAIRALDRAEQLGFVIHPDFRRDLEQAAGAD